MGCESDFIWISESTLLFKFFEHSEPLHSNAAQLDQCLYYRVFCPFSLYFYLLTPLRTSLGSFILLIIWTLMVPILSDSVS